MGESKAAPKRAPQFITASQWRQIVNSATDTAIISTDRDGGVTSWNEGAQRMLGWSEIEMLGETLDRLFPEEHRAGGQLAQEMTDAIEDGRGGGDEGWRRRKDCSRFWATGETMTSRAGRVNVSMSTYLLTDSPAATGRRA
jgi:PAS domain S-box-containing protein